MPGIIRRIGRACHLRALAALSIAVPLLVASTVANAAYPDRVITLIVPFAAGGPTDIVARIVSVAFQKALGQSVVVENRGGAAGNIGMTIAARAAPDGYTLLLSRPQSRSTRRCSRISVTIRSRISRRCPSWSMRPT